MRVIHCSALALEMVTDPPELIVDTCVMSNSILYKGPFADGKCTASGIACVYKVAYVGLVVSLESINKKRPSNISFE